MTITDYLTKDWDESKILTREECLQILNFPDNQLDLLIEAAFKLRTKYKGNRVNIQLLTNVRSF